MGKGKKKVRKVTEMSGSEGDLVRVYRWKWRVIFLRFAHLLYFVPAMIMVPFLVAFFSLLAPPGEELQFLMPLLVCLSPVVFVLGLYFVLPMLQCLLSYLKLFPDGLEYRSWPSYGLRAKWEDIECLGKYRAFGIFSYDALYLKSASPFGWQIMMRFRRMLRLSTQHFVILTGFRGWPDGDLADDLRRCVPHIFSRVTEGKM